MRVGGTEYSLREAAGAFGDLGTLIPFLAGCIAVARIDPAGVLIAFGLFRILAGMAFRTPIPIQPMKAIGTAAILATSRRDAMVASRAKGSEASA